MHPHALSAAHPAAWFWVAAPILACTALTAGAATPNEVLEEIRGVALDSAAARVVTDAELDLPVGHVRLERGWLVPATPVDGKPREAVFVGDAVFSIDPPDAVEAEQLRIFTGAEGKLEVGVDRLLIVAASGEILTKLHDAGVAEPLGGQEAERAGSMFERWKAGAGRHGAGVEPALLKATLGDPPAQSYVALWCHSESLGEFYYLFDPDEQEQISLGQFVRPEFDEVDEDRIQREIRREQRRGRSSRLSFEDLGDWDTWVSTSQKAAAGAARPGNRGFEPRHYKLDVHVDLENLGIEGTAEIDIVSIGSDRRTVELDLFGDLEIRSVRDGQGTKLSWERYADEAIVILPQRPGPKDSLRIIVDYGGPIFDTDPFDKGVFTARTTTRWYPHVGTADLATYDVTFHWPKRQVLLSGGQRVEGGEEEGGVAWERRTIDVPVAFCAFEIGNYKVEEAQIGDVKLRVGILSCDHQIPDPRIPKEVVETIGQALKLYETLFGEYPLQEMTVATAHRWYSQGSQSFLTLTHYLLTKPPPGIGLGELRQYRTQIISHELAHQWWGNKVGWVSYRDQWLSEALAEYSAQTFTYLRLGKDAQYRKRVVEDLRSSLTDVARNGRRMESLGPVTLGYRLDNSLGDAVNTVVYDKGCLALSTIGQLLGEATLFSMLHTLADNVAFRQISTETFMKALEHMSSTDLDAIAGRFVYGTGVPTIYYGYDVEPHAEGGWVVRGKGSQLLDGYVSTRLEQTAAGGWDAIPIYMDEMDPALTQVPASYRVTVETDEGPVERLAGMLLEGRDPTFELRFAERPTRFEIDPQGRTLAFFVNQTLAPKSSLERRGAQLARLGRRDEARDVLLQALQADFLGGSAVEVEVEVETDDRRLDSNARRADRDIQYDLAELHLLAGEDQLAEEAIEAGLQALYHDQRAAFHWRRTKLETRLALRRGDYDKAYSNLKTHVQLDFRQSGEDSTTEQLRRAKFSDGIVGDGQTYALLAIAAHFTDHEPVCQRAIEEAQEKGADMSPLLLLHAE
jgi:hypothetical protein